MQASVDPGWSLEKYLAGKGLGILEAREIHEEELKQAVCAWARARAAKSKDGRLQPPDKEAVDKRGAAVRRRWAKAFNVAEEVAAGQRRLWHTEKGWRISWPEGFEVADPPAKLYLPNDIALGARDHIEKRERNAAAERV